jgi:serine/threonine protein kinase
MSQLYVDDSSVANEFHIGRQLGRGNYGTVYEATCKHTGTVYACKVIEKKMSRHPEFINLESEIMCQIDHPNIAKVYKVFVTVTKLYIIMELLYGGELLDVVSEFDELSENHVVSIMLPIIDAMKY